MLLFYFVCASVVLYATFVCLHSLLISPSFHALVRLCFVNVAFLGVFTNMILLNG